MCLLSCKQILAAFLLYLIIMQWMCYLWWANLSHKGEFLWWCDSVSRLTWFQAGGKEGLSTSWCCKRRLEPVSADTLVTEGSGLGMRQSILTTAQYRGLLKRGLSQHSEADPGQYTLHLSQCQIWKWVKGRRERLIDTCRNTAVTPVYGGNVLRLLVDAWNCE